MSSVVGIDIGTSGVKAIVLDGDTVRAEANRALGVSVPHPGWSEQHPDIWVDAVFACLDQLASEGALRGVDAIGLSAQMLGLVLLDAAHRPVRPAILWNDQRALTESRELIERVPDIGHRTNGPPDPGFNAAKLLWLRAHEPEALDGARMMLLPKDYVRLALTGDLATEPSDAGGTQLFDVAANGWADDLCDAAGWDPAHLPPVLESWASAGILRHGLAKRWGLDAIPVATGAGDNMAATLGNGAGAPGDMVITLGTSGVVCLVHDRFRPAPKSVILTSAHAAPDTFLSMAVVMSATQSLDWMARTTGTDPATLAREAETVLMDNAVDKAPLFLPALTGIRTPHGRPGMTGRIHGLRAGTDRAMLGWATLEGVAFQIADCVEATRATGAPITRISVVGGGTRSGLWMRMIAALIGQSVGVSDRAPVAACQGAARLARVAAGLDSRKALASPMPDPDFRITSDGDLRARLAQRRHEFNRLF